MAPISNKAMLLCLLAPFVFVLKRPSRLMSGTLLNAQGMHASILFSALVSPPGEGPMDAAVASLWDGFQSLSWLTHQPLFEAHVAVFAFVAWIAFFESIHLWLPNPQRHRLDGKLPTNPLAGFDPRREPHKTVVPAVTYLVSIWVFQQCGGAALFGSTHLPIDAFETPTFARVATETAFGVFLYDLLFYPFHFWFHASRNRRWRSLHTRHHQFARQEDAAHNAVETVQNHYLDAGVQVFINICVQHISPFGVKHPLSRVLHNLMVTYLLSESHSGYDLPFQSHRLFPTVFGGAPRHELHHQRGDACYHQFFMWLDDGLGFGPDGGLSRYFRPKQAAEADAQNRHERQATASPVTATGGSILIGTEDNAAAATAGTQ
jgi:sterol desaturase/sphingolipid hydroxylase (fatty acid hydroxylase superfamily)